MLRILTDDDLSKRTDKIGELVEVLYDNLKGELSKFGYHDAGPGTQPGYRVMRKDLGHINVERMKTEYAADYGRAF